MQQLKSGDVVRVRCARWQVADVRPFAACQMVELSRADPAALEGSRTVLAPFDVIEQIARRGRTRHVSARRWRRACRELLAADAPPGSLRSARHASMELLPHQLEPSLAILRGLGSRVLLADDVGLGKTLQAGLIVSELRARGWADRILILTPAGLREQWAAELKNRLAIASTILDAAEVRRLASAWPPDINPWTTAPVAIASIDYVKRAEVLPAASACRWDVVIIDEAHGVTAESDRHEAAGSLAGRAAYVLLLTATPHSGDRRAFSSLCGIGGLDEDPLLVFRRSRLDVGLGQRRRVRCLRVSLNEAETRMHGLLAQFARAVRREHGDAAALGLSVLQKRASSSARSLELSVTRRLEALASGAGVEGGNTFQFALPLDDESGDLGAADEPPPWSDTLTLSDREREQRLLSDLREAARAASADETKIRVLRRLLRRIKEPALIFTEYRDTLLHLHDRLERRAMVLHGGLDRSERAATLAAFASGQCAVLLATDAAGEGLNLHHTCRLVMNLELPWNPMRLEQRIGRVDRIGQRRTVHVVHLVGRQTSEASLLGRLRDRVASARAEIDAPDPIGGSAQHAMVDLPDGCLFPRLTGEAAAEAGRLAEARRCPAGINTISTVDGPWVLRARRPPTRMRLRGRTLLLFVAAQEDGWGRVVESTLVPLALKGTAPDNELLRVADGAAAAWRIDAHRLADAFVAARLRRERSIAAASERAPKTALQPGLFDRRAQLATAETDEMHRDDRTEQHRRIAVIERTAAWIFGVRLVLVLAP